MSHTQNKDLLTLSIAIVLAGGLVGLGIYLGAREIAGTGFAIGGAPSAAEAADNPGALPTLTGPELAKKMIPVTQTDHIRGSANAKIFLVEYSDLECPFCKRFHDTMRQVTAGYDQNQVAWVYRHYPLDSIHPNARKEAIAAECAAELGGNTKFWAYIDRLFDLTQSNNTLQLTELPNIAEFVGLDKAKFKTCLDSGRTGGIVDAQQKGGNDIGVRGTPYTIVTNGKTAIPVNGSQPAEAVKAAIDQLLK